MSISDEVNVPSMGPAKPVMPMQDLGQNSDLFDEAHRVSDADSGQNALHHTLGTGQNQASPGSHIHDGTKSKKLGAGLGLTLTGAKGGNVALTNLIALLANFIEFTDSTT